MGAAKYLNVWHYENELNAVWRKKNVSGYLFLHAAQLFNFDVQIAFGRLFMHSAHKYKGEPTMTSKLGLS